MAIMKRTLLIAAAVTGAFALTASTQAGTPKADQWAENHRTVAATTPTPDMLDRSVKQGSPKASQWAEAHQAAPSTGQIAAIDVAHGPRPFPKDPLYDQKMRGVQEIQVAPLK
jgi:hypothetical protein